MRGRKFTKAFLFKVYNYSLALVLRVVATQYIWNLQNQYTFQVFQRRNHRSLIRIVLHPSETALLDLKCT